MTYPIQTGPSFLAGQTGESRQILSLPQNFYVQDTRNDCQLSSIAVAPPFTFFSSFPYLSLSLRAGVLVYGYHLPSFDLSPLSRNLSFIAFLSSDRIILCFLCFFFLSGKSRICRKITLSYFYFFDKVHRHFIMRWSYAQKPLFPFWRKFQNR